VAHKRSSIDVPERQATVRAELRRVLSEGFFTSRDLSVRVGISEKDVAEHLEHLSRSLKPTGERLEIEQARCLACGFVFKDRARLSKPSRCPVCKRQRLALARYRVLPASSRAPGRTGP
jgi:predicted Zn-ribbon and HTH transcriptional regulator